MWEANWIAVIAAALVGFFIGGLWYGPLFQKPWMAASGMTEEKMKGGNMPLIFGTTFVLNLIAAFVLGHVLATYGGPDLQTSTLIGSGIGAGFVATTIGVNYLYLQKPLKLFLIDAGYWIVAYTAMGAIFGLL